MRLNKFVLLAVSCSMVGVLGGWIPLARAADQSSASQILPALPVQLTSQIRLISQNSGQSADLAVLQQEADVLAHDPDVAGNPGKISGALTKKVRDAGFPIGQVVFMAQDQDSFSKTGVLRLHVFWGAVGKVVVHNHSRIHTARLQRMIEQALCQDVPLGDGCVLRSTTLERASTLISSQTGVSNLSLNLSPADVGVGQTEVIATVQGDPGSVHGSVLANNGGVPANGKNLFGVAASAENLLGMGDLWSVQAFRSSQDALTGVLMATLPVGVRGWRAIGQYSRSNFSLLVGNGQVTGTSTSVSAGASYPLVLQFDRVANFEVDIGSMNSQSTLSGTSSQQLENRTIPYADVMLSASSGVAAAPRGQAVWVGGMTLTGGDASDMASATTQDAATSNVLHTFTKLNAQYSIQQPLGGSRFFDFNVRGQLSSRNLDYSEAMGIGGSTGLRAYPVDEGEFDDGFISTVALQRDYALDAGGKISPNVFIDYAHGNSYHNVWANWNSANPSLQNTLTLADYGIGVTATYRKFSTSLTLAHSMPSSPVSATEPNTSTQLFWAGQWGF